MNKWLTLPWKRKDGVGRERPPDRTPTRDGFNPPQSAERLLQDDRRSTLLDLIWEQTSMSRAMFQKLYLAPISRFADLVQEFPASETHHHAYPGGMLDHALELTYHGLRLRQSAASN